MYMRSEYGFSMLLVSGPWPYHHSQYHHYHHPPPPYLAPTKHLLHPAHGYHTPTMKLSWVS